MEKSSVNKYVHEMQHPQRSAWERSKGSEKSCSEETLM